ncbi:sugar phosphate isomerase/epimerase family protein [Adhaeretor mobilis]|uniref:Xylose isomerase-like TIM barrel n=1 Tax=Adhaeretor mobilis TaxID=1930276 RepID=A0A517N2H5_9BACT|nr:sugar phosphate isomerase/epimerase [Adhaeretor mobilis]QDT01350.1 Xylose isomerase-like TIM barrel [Adhaeretor mobilis]
MIVCASMECLPDLPREEVPGALVDLEYTAIELPVHSSGVSWYQPSAVAANLEEATEKFRDTKRLNISAFSFDTDDTGDAYYEQFGALCKLAKSLRVVPIVVPAAKQGTPFNEEIDRLRELVKIASMEGCLVAMKTTIGCMSEDPDTAAVLCDNVKGLGVCLDPSCFITGPWQGKDFGKIVPYTFHVQMRDSTTSKMHVRVGQGEMDYAKLIGQLEAANYKGALSVHMPPLEDLDHRAEMRKMRLLLESLL